MRPEDVCPRPDRLPPQPTEPLAPGIHPSAVYRCASPEQARALLAGEAPGYVYSRDAHPNADLLAEKCRELHEAEHAVVCGSGMAALALAALAVLEPDDHVIVSHQLYGRSQQFFTGELARLGVASSVVDTSRLDVVQKAITNKTRLIVVETISNPLLRVADLAGLAKLKGWRVKLLVDNTFASPLLCRPLALGADIVVESLTKIMNGHSDVLLGLVCGRQEIWDRVPLVHSCWGFSPSPFDCWLACRGLGTLALRFDRADANAMAAAHFLGLQRQVETVHYPGLSTHVDHDLVRRQFGGRGGAMVTFTLRGGTSAAEQFITAAKRIPFCPSLGDISTTLSHPASTSHRTLSAEAKQNLGITGGTIRLSVGIESPEAVCEALGEALTEVR